MRVPGLDETHDQKLESWVTSANAPGCPFPIQNLPFGVAETGEGAARHIVVAIGDQALDLAACVDLGLFDDLMGGAGRVVLTAGTLNALMARPPADWQALRLWLSRALRTGSALQGQLEACLLPQDGLRMVVPAKIGDYTDFYCSVEHATNIGKIFRPDNPLFPNFKSLPIGYHGRASSIVVSGTDVHRPSGQLRQEDGVVFAPCRMLDFELELGAFIGGPTNKAGPLPLAAARERLFGFCLVNDWSARDIQAWEYQPLGPFLAKSFATSISPWVVTRAALAPFQVSARPRDAGDPPLLDYLADSDDAAAGALDIRLRVGLRGKAMEAGEGAAHVIAKTNSAGLYWTFAQMVTHHMSNGCPLVAGDMIASGTISGEAEGAQGSMMELTRRGAEPLSLGEGETRGFLHDYDEVVFTGQCERDGFRSIGFGECRGMVLPAVHE